MTNYVGVTTEVQAIIRAFSEADCVDGRGGPAVSKEVFAGVVCRVAGVKQIPPAMLSSAWQAMIKAALPRTGKQGLLIPWEPALGASAERRF